MFHWKQIREIINYLVFYNNYHIYNAANFNEKTMSIFSTIVKALTATGVVSGAAGVGSKIYLKNGHGFGTMDVVNSTSSTPTSDPSTQSNTESQDTSKHTKPESVSDTAKTTYGSLLKEKQYQLVETNTSNDIILNIMMERLDPTKNSLKYSKKQRFSVSEEVTFGTKTFTSQVGDKSYSLTILQKPDQQYIEPWKKSCIQALSVEVIKTKVEDSKTQEYSEMAKLREWCTIPTVDQVLRRHKLTPLNTDVDNHKDDAEWKKVIAGGWFKKETDKDNWEDQSFIKGTDLDTVIGNDKRGINSESEVDKTKIDVFKNKCKAELEKAFERKNFYLTTQFINGITETDKPTIDPFQEVALFCVKPFKASEYVTASLQGLVHEQVEISTDDYCYLSNIENKDSWTTNNPLGGKSFWCAVKSLYKAKVNK
ncbi:hypothetical protein MHSWG343_10040 [Candidatus Mycoplasma haematohominis]|uniref:Uncharacterized protein n=1 Tax=Candidatus Mycoplasma haematohominis TaxID=1494318 RepID=A0A478FUI9_9MOLU|nr:hypothetical protein MHSWG343_10040 [Candidatus Mycoplasma haemohominis]